MCNKLRFDDNFSHMWQDTEKFSAGGVREDGREEQREREVLQGGLLLKLFALMDFPD